MFDFIEQVKKSVEPHHAMMRKAERDIWASPETGFREWKTNAYMKERFEELGYTLTMAGNIPGFYTDFDTGRPGPTVAVMGELDSVLCADHPESDPETGAVHACGHNAQCAALLGIAGALKDPALSENLSGKIRLVAVPAEELLELGFRSELKKKGIIHYFGGKVEFLYRGYFDDVDAALMVHTSNSTNSLLGIPLGSNGCISKTITFTGKAAHAGGAPHEGINALYAATLGIHAINALRETFQDKDHIRVHPILTVGGSAVNVIPGTACLESYVRGASLESILAANEKVNRALAASAAAMGATVKLSDLMGYFPLHPDTNMSELARQIACTLVDEKDVKVYTEWGTGSTDMGDIASVMPALHPYCAGAVGTSHGSDFYIKDPEGAVIRSAVFQVAILYAMLENGAKRTEDICKNARPHYKSIKEYFEMTDIVEMEKEAVAYDGKGQATLSWKK